MSGLLCRRGIFFVLALFLLFPALSAEAALVNINTASLEELDTLPGIGASKAQAIIDYREGPDGPFETIEEIKEVSGIGDATYEDIKDLITVGETEEEPEDSGTATSTSSVSTSPHYSSASLSNLRSTSDFKIGAGRDRIAAFGTPIEFKVETGDDAPKRNSFNWNFGDGLSGSGAVTTHVYDYPGDYVVVLSAEFSDGESVARANVKVFEPELSITLANPERIELSNGSKYEVNLFGRAVVSGSSVFTFPKDTIIKPGARISFSSRTTGLAPAGIHDARLMVVGDNFNSFALTERLEEDRSEQIALIQEEIASIAGEIARLQAQEEFMGGIGGPEEVEEPEEEVPQTGAASEALPEESDFLESLRKFFIR